MTLCWKRTALRNEYHFMYSEVCALWLPCATLCSPPFPISPSARVVHNVVNSAGQPFRSHHRQDTRTQRARTHRTARKHFSRPRLNFTTRSLLRMHALSPFTMSPDLICAKSDAVPQPRCTALAAMKLAVHFTNTLFIIIIYLLRNNIGSAWIFGAFLESSLPSPRVHRIKSKNKY